MPKTPAAKVHADGAHQPDDTAPRWRNVAWLAALTGIPESTIRAGAAAGRIPCVRPSPRVIRFLPDQIAAWVASLQAGTGGSK